MIRICSDISEENVNEENPETFVAAFSKRIPMNENDNPIVETKKYFHVASRVASLRSWYINIEMQSVVASVSIHKILMLSDKKTPVIHPKRTNSDAR